MKTVKLVFLIALLLFNSIVFSQIKLPKLISDGAILQRNTRLKIWGWASPNEKITFTFKGKSYKTKANKNSTWEFNLPSQKAGGPYNFKFKGKNEITINNVMFGDVWLCSGQSNMELPMKRVRDAYPLEIKNAKNNNIRQFLVEDKFDFNKEHTDFDAGSWVSVSPETIKTFSATAYFFSKELYNKYKIPIGLINSALGGSPIESWLSEDALKQFPDSYKELQQFKNKNYVNKIKNSDLKRQKNWYKEINNKDIGFQKNKEWFLNINDSDWDEMSIPNFWKHKIGKKNGVVWFRKTIYVPKAMIGKKAKLWLGRIVDQDFVYVNGEFVGTTGYQYPPRKYIVPNKLLKEGKNTITIRIINKGGNGGFISDKPYFLSVENNTIDLTGKWKFKLGAKMKSLKGATFIRWKAGGLYKRMIAPLTKHKIKGVIWYQGESNTGNPSKYYKTFPAMINNWRTKWGYKFPFLYVQLANFMKETTTPTESNWADLRNAQLSALKLAKTGIAVITDIGEWNDIHPLNKQDVGKRLAYEAFDKAYKESNNLKSSPVPKKANFYTDSVKITFKFNGQKLIVKDGTHLKFFEISADGKTFFKAKAAILNNKTVSVSHSEIKKPIAVRYAWANNPKKANLFSAEGLPASPFEIRK